MGESAVQDAHLDLYRRWHQLAQPYFRWQFSQFEPWVGRRVADVGCGPGNLTASLLGRDLYLGIDQDPAMLAAVQAEYGGNAAVHTAAGDVSSPELPALLRSERVDTVLRLNLLEHIEDDRAALANLVAGLEPGGTLGILVPAMPSIYGTLDAIDHHYRRYTLRGVADLLAGAPLTTIRLRYFNAVGALGWWWAGRVRRMQTHADSNYTIMYRLIPILRPLERLVPPPFGQSVIAVARRR